MEQKPKSTRWIDAPSPSHLDDVTHLARMIAKQRGSSTVEPLHLRLARDRLAPRRAA